MMYRMAALTALVMWAGACAGEGAAEPRATTPSSEVDAPVTTAGVGPDVQPCADVVAATVDRSGDTYRFDVTVRSGDTGWDKYADAWVVRDPAGTVLGERVLLHPHENEQPFTRSLSGVVVPEGVEEVEIAARDSVNGFCGDTVSVAIRP